MYTCMHFKIWIQLQPLHLGSGQDNKNLCLGGIKMYKG